MNRRTIVMVSICLLVILCLLPSLCGAGEVERASCPTEVESSLFVTIDRVAMVKWYLDSELVYENNSYLTKHYWNYTFPEKGEFHNVTAVVTDINGSTDTVKWIIWIGTKFVVPNETAAVTVTTLPVLAAPGEQFNVTTTVEPDVTKGAIACTCFHGTSNGLLLLQPDEEGIYRSTWLLSASNNTTLINTWIANSTNSGTFLLGFSTSATIAEDPAGNSIPINFINAEIKISPRYDINADFVVNIIDLVILRQHYGESTSEPYPRYDMNKDGIVNIMDLVTLKQHYGEQIETI